MLTAYEKHFVKPDENLNNFILRLLIKTVRLKRLSVIDKNVGKSHKQINMLLLKTT